VQQEKAQTPFSLQHFFLKEQINFLLFNQAFVRLPTCASPAGRRIETQGRWAKKVEKLKTS
ncbi:hypothetical protein, partial [Desulfatiferula olefinivorans]